ncbi:UNVERIFIED_CONTAM: hypothetical protein K2H54_033383 [Gekko kuhli]
MGSQTDCVVGQENQSGFQGWLNKHCLFLGPESDFRRDFFKKMGIWGEFSLYLGNQTACMVYSSAMPSDCFHLAPVQGFSGSEQILFPSVWENIMPDPHPPPRKAQLQLFNSKRFEVPGAVGGWISS